MDLYAWIYMYICKHIYMYTYALHTNQSCFLGLNPAFPETSYILPYLSIEFCLTFGLMYRPEFPNAFTCGPGVWRSLPLSRGLLLWLRAGIRYVGRCAYGVATVSRIDKIIGLFCRISSLL